MKNEKTKEEFALIISEHAPFGNVLVPYILDGSAAPSYQMLEVVSAQTLSNPDFHFTDDEREIVRLLTQANDQSLCRAFSKEKNVRSFLANIKQDTIDNLVSPFLDRTFCKALDIARRTSTPVFLRSEGYNRLHADDRLTIPERPARATFYFRLLPDGALSYTVRILSDSDSEFSLFGKKIVELTGSPATIAVGGVLYRFADLQSSKFRPFTQKKHIVVQPQVVPRYMSGYVRQCVMNNYVRASGFRIVKREGSCRAVLRLEEDAMGFALRLYFAYGDNLYEYGRKVRTVELEEVDGQYTFYTYPRQTAVERQAADALCEEGLVHVSHNEFQIDDANADRTNVGLFVRWCNVHMEALKALGIDFERQTQQAYYCGNVELRMHTKADADWFDISGSVMLDGFEVPFLRLAKNIRSGNAEYTLPDGSIFVIPSEWFATWSELLAFAKVGSEQIRLSKMHASLLPSDIAPHDDDAMLLRPTDEERQGELHAELRPYQLDGFRWMNTLRLNNRGGILADDMGLGKTLQTIALLSHVYSHKADNAEPSGVLFGDMFNQSGLPASLIVLPVSLVHNWAAELRRFAPHLSVYVYGAVNRPRSTEAERIFRHYHVVLTSYGILRNDSDILAACKFEYLILDESQYIKNPTSKTYRAAERIVANHRLTISGTPIENRLTDLWAQMNIVNPGLLGSANFFRNHFETPITKGGAELAEQQLRKITQPFILRRTKEMVASDLPPITSQTILCDMSDEQRECYEREKSGARNHILSLRPDDLALGQQKFMALKALTRMRLLANHPSLIYDDFEGSSGKTDMVMTYIRSIILEGHKMLVFSSFVRDLDLIARLLSEERIAHCMLTGHTANRESVINRFAHSTEPMVFLISLKAGGVGLNLTQADYVALLNPWWNPAAEAQAINRAHRIGQTKSVFVYRFLTRNTIEEKIAQLQESKRALASDFIPSDNLAADLTT